MSQSCVRGCTRPRRHQADCTDDTCAGCEPQRTETGHLCRGCIDRLNTDILAKVADVLEGHRYSDYYEKCSCGFGAAIVQGMTVKRHGLTRQAHRAHVAAVLTDALTDELAAAWDEGYRASAGDHWWTFDPEEECEEPHRPNPYRTGA